ncbi:protein CASP-like [Lineus longissimus]|uniref:protein CASP-like n=1 Tax=Lineus longissimus TaxID=88925 RepID=UPI00315C85C3
MAMTDWCLESVFCIVVTRASVVKTEQNAGVITFTLRYDALQQQYTEAVNTVHEQKQLISQLEEDLRSVNALSSLFRGEGEGEPSTNPSSEIMADALKEVTIATSTPDSKSNSAAGSLLPIVQSQRERFRVRAQELEAQNIAHQQQIQMIQNEMDKLRSDNVKLYEKIKFLQAYPSRSRPAGDDGALNRYSTQYEEKLDPFTTFNKKERMRKYANLKPYDKITLSMGRFIMGNKMARTIAFFYTIILHCLVFLVLYKVAHTEDCKRDLASECHQNFAEHMMKVHGDSQFNPGHVHKH